MTDNTCATPNGKIQISVNNLPGEKIYMLKNTTYPFKTYADTTTNNTCEFTGMPSGVYTVSVSQGDCYFEKTEEYEIASRIFKISNIAITPATTLEGNGSATVTFANLNGTAEWLNDDLPFDSREITQSTVTTQNGGISPGAYALAIRSSTGCVVEANITIDKPAYWGEINLNYTKDSLRIFTDYLAGNKLFEPYKFRIINAAGAVIIEDKKPNMVIRQPGNYALYAHHAQDSMLLYDFVFPVDSIKASVDIAPPLCPQDMGTVTVRVQDGGFGKLSAVKMSVNGLNYSRRTNL